MINDLKLNLKSGLLFLSSKLIVSLILLILSSFLFQFSLIQVIIFCGVLILTDIVILSLIGQKRRSELDSIKKIIENIRINSFKSADDIKMESSLLDLEQEVKSMFLKTNNAITHLKKLEQYRTEFLGNVSHELRTPIFAIQGYIETLLEGALNDDKVNKVFLQKANNHTLYLNNLVNDLIDISMIESGKMQMSFRYFNAHEFLDGVIFELRQHAVKKNLELNLIPFENTIQIFGDRQRLRQVMNNLIMNAIKYTESGSVEVGVIQKGKYVKVFVRDTGIGIAENDINRIFERFYRVDRDRSREMGGSGLGLAIVKHIVEAHGSKVEVSSQLKKGSEFYFSLKI